jgi:hypothetical protein
MSYLETVGAIVNQEFPMWLMNVQRWWRLGKTDLRTLLDEATQWSPDRLMEERVFLRDTTGELVRRNVPACRIFEITDTAVAVLFAAGGDVRGHTESQVTRVLVFNDMWLRERYLTPIKELTELLETGTCRNLRRENTGRFLRYLTVDCSDGAPACPILTWFPMVLFTLAAVGLTIWVGTVYKEPAEIVERVALTTLMLVGVFSIVNPPLQFATLRALANGDAHVGRRRSFIAMGIGVLLVGVTAITLVTTPKRWGSGRYPAEIGIMPFVRLLAVFLGGICMVFILFVGCGHGCVRRRVLRTEEKVEA